MLAGVKRGFVSVDDLETREGKRQSTSPSGTATTQDDEEDFDEDDDDLLISEVRQVSQPSTSTSTSSLNAAVKNENNEIKPDEDVEVVDYDNDDDIILVEKPRTSVAPPPPPSNESNALLQLFTALCQEKLGLNTAGRLQEQLRQLYGNNRYVKDIIYFLSAIYPTRSMEAKHASILALVKLEEKRLSLKTDIRQLNTDLATYKNNMQQLQQNGQDLRDPTSSTALHAHGLLRHQGILIEKKAVLQRNIQQVVMCQRNLLIGHIADPLDLVRKLLRAFTRPSNYDFDLVQFLSPEQKSELDNEQNQLHYQAYRMLENAQHVTNASRTNRASLFPPGGSGQRPTGQQPSPFVARRPPLPQQQQQQHQNINRSHGLTSLFTRQIAGLSGVDLRNRYEGGSEEESDYYPYNGAGSELFPDEYHTFSDFDRKKLEELLENISIEDDIPPEQRQGTPEQLTVSLYEHQKLGLTWLQKTEDKSRGGLLADDMGLGKTIQMIALMVSRARPAGEAGSRTNLIITPVALVHQWAREIKRFVRPENKLNVLLYHFSTNPHLKDKRDTLDLTQYDCVITTYQTVLQDHGKEEKPDARAPLFRTKWYRIILDEAHYIKNRIAKTSIACSQLDAKFRWCLSGTPMQNRIDELYPVFRFLRLEPYCVWEKFRRDFVRQIDGYGQNEVLRKLNVLIQAIALRRTKSSKIDGKPLLQLPEKHLELDTLTFNDSDEEEYYKSLEMKTQVSMNKYIKENTYSKNIQNILVLLLRLRQACCHPKLLERSEMLKHDRAHRGRMTEDTVKLAQTLAPDVVQRVQEDGENETFTCPVCMEPQESTSVLLFYPCGHPICQDCMYGFFGDSEEAEDAGSKRRGPQAPCHTCKTECYQKDLIDYSTFALVHVDKLSGPEIMIQWKRDRAHQVAEARKKRRLLEHRKIELQDERLLNEELDMFKDDLHIDTSAPQPSVRKIKPWHSFGEDNDDDDDDIKPVDFGKEKPRTDIVWDSDEEMEEVKRVKPWHKASYVVKNDPEPSESVKQEYTDGSVKEEVKEEDKEGTQDNKQGVKEESQENVKKEESQDAKADVKPSIANEEEEDDDEQAIRADEATLTNVVDGLGLGRLFDTGWISSTKVDECIRLLHKIYKEYPGEKVLIFSQFTSLLDFLEVPIIAEGIDYMRYDGSMTAADRNDSIVAFFDKPEVKTMLVSLRAGNVGLTLTCASHVVILDPFWNPFVEDQAMDRAHRIGQQRPVHVHRLVVKGTVEDRILQLQDKKRELIESAWGEGDRAGLSRLSKDDMLFLFGMRPQNGNGTNAPQ